MATFATIEDVLESVETDLSDAVLQRMLDGAEHDVRAYLDAADIALLPVVVWFGSLDIAPGVIATLGLDSGVRDYPIVRFEGTVAQSGETPAFGADARFLETSETGTGDLVPLLADGTPVTTATMTVTVDAADENLTFDTLGTAPVLVITRVLGLHTVETPAMLVQAVLDLVDLATRYRGIETERTGQYTVTLQDYHTERGKVLQRLIFSGSGSLVA